MAMKMLVRLGKAHPTSGQLILLVALFIAATANTAFFSAAIAALGAQPLMWPFYVSLFIAVTGVFVLLLSAFCHRVTVKPVLMTVLVLSSVLSYYANAFGIVFDEQMIANIFQTDSAEASDLMTPSLMVWVTLFGLLPALAVWRVTLSFPDWKTETKARLKLAAAAGIAVIASGAIFSGHYAGLLRFHREVTSKAVPTHALLSAVRHATRSLSVAQSQKLHVTVAEDAKIAPADGHRELIIMVVGETARADHWGLNGYARDTTPELRKANVLNFPDFWSCGTSTAISVPCMFSNLGRDRFDSATALATDNALDVLSRAGVSVLWRDNNSSSKGVANHVAYQDYRSPAANPVCEGVECRDEGMLAGLQDYIDAQKGDVLIVLHQMGNHGPAYYKRYPKEFERFTPVCATSDLGSCTPDQVRNTYDNAILYTDHFLSEVIDLLKANDGRFETAMFYVSDHGESLGEYGVYLHGAPYALAPDAQRHVPAVMWFGESIKHDLATQALAERSRRKWSHDNVFATLLGFFEVQSTAYGAHMDILEHVAEPNEAGTRPPPQQGNVNTIGRQALKGDASSPSP